MHTLAILHAVNMLNTDRSARFSLDGFNYELRETALDFWTLYAREWGGTREITIAYLNQYGQEIDYSLVA